MSIGGIYRIRNIVDNKFYIGSAKNFYKRWIVHKSLLRRNKQLNKHFQFSWNKYGEENFIFEILESYENPTQEELIDWEQWYLDNTNCCNDKYGYNLCKKADTTYGRVCSEETKRKISIATKGKKGYWKGKHMPEETKSKLSKSKIGKKVWYKGIPFSKEAKENMSKSHKGSFASEETKEKMRKAHANISEETRKKISEASQHMWDSRDKEYSKELKEQLHQEVIKYWKNKN